MNWKRQFGIIATGVLLSLPWIGAASAQAIGSYNYANITASAPTTTTLKSSPGILHSICFNKPVANEVVTIYDSLTAAGTLIGTITVPSSPQPGCLSYDVAFGTGLTILTATASSDITVSYR